MFSLKPKRILYRIIIPVAFLFGLTTLSTWFFSAFFLTRYLDQNLKQQMEQVSDAISQFPYILNPTVLNQLKEVIDAEIVLFDLHGSISASTITDGQLLDKIKLTLGHAQAPQLTGRTIQLGRAEYRTIIRPFSLSGKGGRLALLVSTRNADALRLRMLATTGIIALLAIVATTATGYYIARSITSPVEELLKATTKISEGRFGEKILIKTDDEIGALAGAFNRMGDELKGYEERVVRSEKLAAAGQMAAGFAHEIRNPLTSIKMLGQVLHKRMKNEPENQEMLGSLVQEIDRLDGIIAEMINRTRYGEPRKQWSDVNRLLLEVLSIAGGNIAAGKIVTALNLSSSIPQVFLDQEKVKQVVWNLILNAKEAMPLGGTMALSTRLFDTDSVEISVTDTGRGIAPEDAERLFHPFFTTKTEGLGLGLTMSRKIIEQHGGSLILENRPEGGANARVLLPVQIM